MKELQEIFREIARMTPDEKAVLATVVDVVGSGYRRPGAKMLILESGSTFGTISGGCLEADVLERAKKVLRTGKPKVFTYDTTKDENSVFSLNMGCRGVIRILLETVNDENRLLNALRFVSENRIRQVVATLVSADSAVDESIGGRVFYSRTNRFYFDNLPSFLADLPELKNDCIALLNEKSVSRMQTYVTEQGNFEFSFELVEPPVSLLIFGAGADAIPLAQIAALLGWQVTVIDHRPAFLTKERFRAAKNLILNNSENFSGQIVFDAQTVAVLMTHNYERDREILCELLKSEAFYIGALGPKRRTENLLCELRDSGENFTQERMSRLFAPIGLDIGADTPQAIALSIAAEIQSVLKNRAGGFLRERKGSIYNSNANPPAKDRFNNSGGGKFEPTERRTKAVA